MLGQTHVDAYTSYDIGMNTSNQGRGRITLWSDVNKSMPPNCRFTPFLQSHHLPATLYLWTKERWNSNQPTHYPQVTKSKVSVQLGVYFKHSWSRGTVRDDLENLIAAGFAAFLIKEFPISMHRVRKRQRQEPVVKHYNDLHHKSSSSRQIFWVKSIPGINLHFK